MINLEEIQSDLNNIIANLELGADSINAAKFLFGSAYFGQDEVALSVTFGISPVEVTGYAEAARLSGIWGEDGKVYANWADEPLSFLLDLMVIKGVLGRTYIPDEGQPYSTELTEVLPWIDDE